MLDPRTRLMLYLCASEERMLKELSAEQVVHVPLDQYQPGHPHYEQLMGQLAMNQRFTFPSSMEPNL